MGVWIETKSGHTITYDCGASHPAWVCGLKLMMLLLIILLPLSHPAWVCGLKPSWEAARAARPVTPCVGVWIETYSEHIANVQKGHTLRGCVD